MTLIEQIGKDFITAYKAKEIDKKDFLGVVKTEVTKESKTPDDTYVIGKLKSMIKNAEASDSLNEDELNILNSYLPQQISESDLKNLIITFTSAEGISDMKGMGKVMGFLKANHGGQYDGKMASTIIKEILN